MDDAKIWCDPGYLPGGGTAWNYPRALGYEPESPVGSGPFRWGSQNTGINLTLDTWRGHLLGNDWKYREYCLDPDGDLLARQPAIDGIIYSFYQTSEQASQALMDNEIDYISWSAKPTQVQELANRHGVALQQSPNNGFTYLGYNMNRPSFGYDGAGNDTGKPLRRAIADSIDKNRIVQRLTLCFGMGGEGPISSISSWFNESIPRYSFDPGESMDVLRNSGYVLDDAGRTPGIGNYWSNPDGSPIGSGINGSLEILIPSPMENPIAAQTGLMICQQLQEIGINAVSVKLTYTRMFERLNVGDFDMCIDFWDGGSPESTMFRLFHSLNTGGDNAFGYQNYTYDTIINWGRAARTEEERKRAVDDAQASICYDLPMDVLYYRTNIEAYRADNFQGWVMCSPGTIFNRMSIINIAPPCPYKLNACFVSPPSAVISNSTDNPITILVRDQDGNPVTGAGIVLNATMGRLADEEGYTNSQGKFTTTFIAPYADPKDPDAMENGTQAVIQIEYATYTDGDREYDPAPPRLTRITVYPEDVRFLNVRISADPDIIDPDYSEENGFGFTCVDVVVEDENGDAVQGAIVAVWISPAVPTMEPAENITDENGRARFILTAVDLPEDSGEVVEYLVSALAQCSDYKPGDNTINVQIVDAAPPEYEPAGASSWDYYFALPISLILIFILIVIMLFRVRELK